MEQRSRVLQDYGTTPLPIEQRRIKSELTPNRSIMYSAIKRAFDFCCSLLALLLLSPLMLIIALLIKIEDRGPVIYTSIRVGTDLRKIRFYKFRSMKIDADKHLNDVAALNDMGAGPRLKIKDDPRVTKVGSVIRKLSLDEIPQLWNVLKGDISIVGPRPHSVYEVEKYDDFALQRFLVKSGLMCYSECCGRSNLSFDESIRLDIQYVEDQSFMIDMKIIAMTILAIIKKDGAV